MKTKSIVLIVPYIGKWPPWFDAHLVSISHNPTVNWLFITDCIIPAHYPDNVRFVPTTLESLNNRVNGILDIAIPLSPRKLCDVRPAYGEIFQDFIIEYDFWGFCDLDIFWGNIRKYITNNILSEYDIVSSRMEAISGHFTLFANIPEINSLHKTIPGYKALLNEKKYMWGEEHKLTNYLKLIQSSTSFPKIYWKKYLLNNNNGKAHQEYHLDKWIWKDGKILELKNGEVINEVMYLHFINWKRTMMFCDVKYSDTPEQFYISYKGIHYKPHSNFAKRWNNFENLIDGYRVREYRRIRKKKLKSLIKRVKRKINKF